MKKYFSLILFISSISVFSQNVGIGINVPNPSAKLDISSSNSGLLIPRLTTSQRDSILSPAEGLQIYNISSGCIELFAFGNWGSVSCYDISNTRVEDYDNNAYSILRLCDQVWMKNNLTVSHYRNGDLIPNVTDSLQWANLTSGAWCWYKNDSASYGAPYGKLYNWYAINDPRGLAPAGWHIPSNIEWNKLATCLGGASVAGGYLKQSANSLWIDPNSGILTNNSSNNIVISQVYGAGGNPGSLYNADFIELHNVSNEIVSLNGYSLQYSSALAGPSTPWLKTNLPSAIILPGGYYLVQMSSPINTFGATALPSPDYVASPPVFLGASNGRVALVSDTFTLFGCPLGSVVDLVGYGSSICFEGTSAASAIDSTHSSKRNYCDDVNNNFYDFSFSTPTPRNSSTSIDLCPEISSSGFNALPAGDRNNQVLYGFWHNGYFSTWWSSNQNSVTDGQGYFLSNTSKSLFSGSAPKKCGFSVRCLKN